MRRRRSLAQLCASLVAIPLVVLPGSPAQADPIPPTNWTPVSLSDLPGARTVMTDGEGGVTAGCPTASSVTTMFKSFSSTGSTVQSPTIGDPGGWFCTGSSAVGKDGTVYLTARSQTGYGQYIQAWKNNSLVWQYTLPCGNYATPQSMVMGADDNLYMVIDQASGSCYSTQLIGLSPMAQASTNPPAPQVVMNQAVYGGGMYYNQGLAAYNDGLVLRVANGVRYVSYSGTSASPIIVSDAIGAHVGLTDRWFEASTSGRAFIPRQPASQGRGCTNPSNVVGGISAVDPTGVQWTTSSLQGCAYVHEVRPMPGGGFAMRYAQSATAGAPEVEKISAFSSSGGLLWTTQIDGVLSPGSIVTSVDLNGNIAIRYNSAGFRTINGSTYRFPEISFRMLSGFTGMPLSGAQFALRGESDTINGPSYMWGSAGELAAAKNTAYVAAYQCATLDSCDRATTKLYAFTVPGLEMDYPRGAILRHSDPSKAYVAMGDSFSSGESVEPFISGTDTSGPNRNVCHRSERAYAKLLDGSLGTRLQLTGFRACSGAKIAQITGTWPNVGDNPPNLGEHAQNEALSSSTDVVTISIGGNDIGFADFVTKCLYADCAAVKQDYLDRIASLGTSLTQVYNTILSDAPNATVYVLGYPELLPSDQNCTYVQGQQQLEWILEVANAINNLHLADVKSFLEAHGFTESQADEVIANGGQVQFTQAEQTAARELVLALDNKIKDTVGSVRPRLRYVDPLAAGSPFVGHQLCTTNQYFTGVDITHPMYSFHPNQLGQDAYRQLLLSQF